MFIALSMYHNIILIAEDSLDLKIIQKSVAVGFSITKMKFHPLDDGLLACYGNLDWIIIHIDPLKNKVLQTLKIDLMLDQLGDNLWIIDCCWLPNSRTHIAVLTPQFVKIYDISKDTLSPAFWINQIEDWNGLNMMTSITIARDTIHPDFIQNNNLWRVYVGTANGVVYTLQLDIQEEVPEHDSLYLVEDLQINSDITEIK